MQTYIYKAIKDNIMREGTTTGFFRFLVKKELEKDGSKVLLVKREPSQIERTILSRFSFGSISSYERILFFRNLSMMLDAGVSISTSLHTLRKQFKSLGAQGVIQKIALEVESGSRLSAAMGMHPKFFPAHIAKTIEVGEQSGTLAKTLDKISEDLEKNYELKRKVQGAIAYPTIILLFMSGSALVLVIFVLPQLIKLYADLGAAPPAITMTLMYVGTFILTYPYIIVAVVVIAIFAFILLMQVRPIRYVVHFLILRLPVVGNLIREYNIVRLTRALTTLLGSGITFITALDACKSTLKNEVYRQKIDIIYPVILHGGTFSDAIDPFPHLFPEQLRQAIIVGENAGKLKDAFEHNSVHYERSVNYQTQMLTTLIEPILMLLAGLLVGLLAYSIFAPLYQVTELF